METTTPVKKMNDIEINIIDSVNTSTEGRIYTEYVEEKFEKEAR